MCENMASDQQFCLRWNNFQSNITSAFENLRDEDDFVDVSLACEGRQVKAHKMVLSACSPYFRSLLKKNPCSHPIIILKDVKYSNLAALIDFMYHGEVNVAHDQLGNFLKTAESLKIRGLAEEDDKKKARSSPVQSPPSHLATELEAAPSPPSLKRRRIQRPERERQRHSQDNGEASPAASRTEHVEQHSERPPDPPVVPFVDMKQEPQDDVQPIPPVIKDSRQSSQNTPVEIGQNHQQSPFASYMPDPTSLSAAYEIPLGLQQSFTSDNRRTEFVPSDEKVFQANIDDSGQSGASEEKDEKNSFAIDSCQVSAEQSELIQEALAQPGPSDAGPDMTQGGSVECSKCGRVFSWIHHLRRHQRLVHSEELGGHPGLRCPRCGRQFRRAHHLRRHVREVHAASDLRVQCPVCGRWFKNSHSLQTHRTTQHACQNQPAWSWMASTGVPEIWPAISAGSSLTTPCEGSAFDLRPQSLVCRLPHIVEELSQCSESPVTSQCPDTLIVSQSVDTLTVTKQSPQN